MKRLRPPPSATRPRAPSGAPRGGAGQRARQPRAGSAPAGPPAERRACCVRRRRSRRPDDGARRRRARRRRCVHVRTDVLDLEISTRGGTLAQADLLAYPRSRARPRPCAWRTTTTPLTLYELSRGSPAPASGPLPDASRDFTSAQEPYALDGGAELRVPLTWTGETASASPRPSSSGAAATHRPRLPRCTTAARRRPRCAPTRRSCATTRRPSARFQRRELRLPRAGDLTTAPSTASSTCSDAKDSHLALEVTNGWIAALQHHFVSAIVPPHGRAVPLHAERRGRPIPARRQRPGADRRARGGRRVRTDAVRRTEAAGRSSRRPRPELDRVADYGRLWFLAQPLFLAAQLGARASPATGASRSSSSPSS